MELDDYIELCKILLTHNGCKIGSIQSDKIDNNKFYLTYINCLEIVLLNKNIYFAYNMISYYVDKIIYETNIIKEKYQNLSFEILTIINISQGTISITRNKTLENDITNVYNHINLEYLKYFNDMEKRMAYYVEFSGNISEQIDNMKLASFYN